MSRRAIDPEERALWQDAMRGVARRHRAATAPPKEPRITPAVPANAPIQGAGDGHLHHPIAGLDRRQALRLKRGQLPVEARLDLHGLTQAEAHRALAGFVARSAAAGRRVLLIVTGKGSREGTGVLKEAVPRWLEEPQMRARVLATAPAVPRDGGAGALYILLRRAR
jgi:DNA-nicking Smr family endonuclease